VKKIHHIISVMLVMWLGIFSQITISHLGHGHELLTQEPSLCTENCDAESHRSSKTDCELFVAKRLLEVNGVVAIASLASYKSNNPQEWVFINPPNSQLDKNIYLVRGPPILL
tara:strand:- start:174 stop:512 length:339 start_codon:yes stop_codon:yes gene_type:complete